VFSKSKSHNNFFVDPTVKERCCSPERTRLKTQIIDMFCEFEAKYFQKQDDFIEEI
jgi:hypothetical protein